LRKVLPIAAGEWVGGGRAAQPGQGGSTGLLVNLQQGIQAGGGVGVQNRLHAPIRLALGLLPGGVDPPFEGGDAGANRALLPEPLAQEVQQERRAIMLQRPLQQPSLQGRLILDRQRAKAEMILNLPAMIAAGLAAHPVVLETVRGNSDLLGDKGHHGVRRGSQVVGKITQQPQGPELQGEAQPIGLGAPHRNGVAIFRGQGEILDQVGWGKVFGKTVEPGALGLAQKAGGHRRTIAWRWEVSFS
jgi:hypothetical protein